MAAFQQPSPTAETFWAIITPYMRCLLGLTAGTGAIVDDALALRFVKGEGSCGSLRSPLAGAGVTTGHIRGHPPRA